MSSTYVTSAIRWSRCGRRRPRRWAMTEARPSAAIVSGARIVRRRWSPSTASTPSTRPPETITSVTRTCSLKSTGSERTRSTRIASSVSRGSAWRPYREHAMALPRETLDAILVDRVRSIGAPGADRPVRSDERCAIGRGDPHTGQRARDGVDCLERAQAVQQAGRLGAQILAADFRAWKPRAIDEANREAVLGEEDGRGRPRRPGADDDDVCRHDRTASMRPRTRYS